MPSEVAPEAETGMDPEVQHQALAAEYCVAVKANPDHVWTQGTVTTMRKVLVELGKALRQTGVEHGQDEPTYHRYLQGSFIAQGMAENTAIVHAGAISRTVFLMGEREAKVVTDQQAASASQITNRME